MPHAIEVNNLVKRYKNAAVNAVDGISFTVEQGSLFALLGPNGAGKTTTISILTTTLTKTSGSVHIAGYDSEQEQTAVRRVIGVVFQHPSLDINLTGEENVRFHAILYGLYRFRPSYGLMPDSYKKRIAELSEILGIRNELFQPIKTFSGGMRRKLEIMRDLMHQPKILFLDEPTTGLDPVSRKNLWEYLSAVRAKQGTTIFLTTHYLEEAEHADRVLIINHGVIAAIGRPQDIRQELTEEYLLIDAQDHSLLNKELNTLNITFSPADDGRLRIALRGREASAIIQSIRTPLSFLHIHSPTLEEAYLEMIGREEQK
ncbi:MAG: ATP-binding cassette domain-containing protein [Candidatus Sungiibacteriota bacterium]